MILCLIPVDREVCTNPDGLPGQPGLLLGQGDLWLLLSGCQQRWLFLAAFSPAEHHLHGQVDKSHEHSYNEHIEFSFPQIQELETALREK